MLIRYYGHVGQESGYGEAANETCMALLEAGFDLEISTTGERLSASFMDLAGCIRDEAKLSPDPDVIIVHTLPLTCGGFLQTQKVREQHPRARCIAYTTWEGAGAAPASIVESLAQFDAVWVPSQSTKGRIEAGGIHRVEIVPHAFAPGRDGISSLPCPACGFHHPLEMFKIGEKVRTPIGEASIIEWSQYGQSVHFRVRHEIGEKESFLPCQISHLPPTRPYRFYYIGAWNVRKNPAGVVRAYLRAFDKSDDVCLTLLCAGASASGLDLECLAAGLAPDGMPPIQFIYNRVPDLQVQNLHRESDCFVSASRGESWNLPAFDAMLAGNHLIVPEHQGTDDFLFGTTADFYGGVTAPAGGEVVLGEPEDGKWVKARYMGTQGLSVREEWVDPDLVGLAIFMQRAYRDRIRDLRLSYNPTERFGRPAVAQLLQRLLQGEQTG